MLFSEVQRRGTGTWFAPSSGAAVSALAHLGRRTLPPIATPPRFVPRTRVPAARSPWLKRLRTHLTRQMILAAAFAAVVLMLATAIPAWAALKGSASSDSAAAASFVRSSAGTTATATTRTEDLSVATFVGRIPFVQQLRYLDALAGTAPQAQRFIEGARQASLAGYLGDVGSQMLPSLGDAPGTKAAIDTWAAATAERQAAAEAERQAAASADAVHSVWQAPAAVAGSRIPDASVTFYACVGDGFCGAMANGQQVFEGAAACSPDLPFGTRFVIASDPASRVFVCLDRGALSPTWVDVWFYDATQGYAWQSAVGTRSDIIIVE